MSIGLYMMNNKSMNKFRVCNVEQLKQKKTLTWNKTVQDEEKACLLIYENEQLFTYINSCPHTGVNLNWKPNEFLNHEGTYIQCAMHGALFKIDNGQCLHGPCLGESLKPIQSEVIDGQIYVYL